jgi:phosphoesterase, MJ0936 family
MKIVIISDTHGDLAALRKVFLIEQPADLWLHAGDVGAAPNEIWPFQGVKGNCDGMFPEFPFRKVYATPYGKLQIEHYPFYGTSAAHSLWDDGIRIFVHGHTHVRQNDIVGGVKTFCPGSLSYPEDNALGTYLVLTVSETAVDAKFKELAQ